MNRNVRAYPVVIPVHLGKSIGISVRVGVVVFMSKT